VQKQVYLQFCKSGSSLLVLDSLTPVKFSFNHSPTHLDVILIINLDIILRKSSFCHFTAWIPRHKHTTARLHFSFFELLWFLLPGSVFQWRVQNRFMKSISIIKPHSCWVQILQQWMRKPYTVNP